MTAGLIKTVAAAAGISSASARRVAGSAAHRYKLYSIPKKGGGQRLVAQPAREVKALQRALVEELQKVLPMHDAATAYRKGSSIIRNAHAHADAKYLLKLDFEAFFPSIGPRALLAHLNKYAVGIWSDAELQFVLDLVLWIGNDGGRGLCIGAPSSPFLSNTVMFDFDAAVADVCSGVRVTYTRYSDDISLSAIDPGVLADVEVAVRELVGRIAYPRLKLNEAKRTSVSRAAAMRVTGLTLSNQGVITVGRVRKRGVRAGVQRYMRGLLDDAEARRLKGELAFVLSVEPEYRLVLFATYGMRAGELV